MHYEGKQRQDDIGIYCLFVFSLKLPEEEAYIGEAEILLEEPPSPSFPLKQPQLRMSFTESVVPQISRKYEDSDWSMSIKKWIFDLF